MTSQGKTAAVFLNDQSALRALKVLYHALATILLVCLSGCDDGLSPDTTSGLIAPSKPVQEVEVKSTKQVGVSENANSRPLNEFSVDGSDALNLVVGGRIYHWSSRALLNDVRIHLEHVSDGVKGTPLAESVTNQDGHYELVVDTAVSAQDLYIFAERDLAREASQGAAVITSSDALAALKIAVGINPNSDPDGAGPKQAPEISPYQFIAADVNKDGRVTSADALMILKIAVKLPSAIASEWLFISESFPFWGADANAGEGAYLIDSQSVTALPLGLPVAALNTRNANFVALQLGDVNGSWKGGDAATLTNDYFQALAATGLAPLSQWGLVAAITGPVEDDTPPTITVVGDKSITHQQGTVYQDAGASAYDQIDGDVSVSVNGTVDFDSAGTYQVTYVAVDAAGNRAQRQRTVRVVDHVAPVVQLTGDTSQVHRQGTPYLDLGATASDDVDGALDVAVSVEIDASTVAGTYTITYTAIDQADNAAQVFRTVHVIAVSANEVFISEYAAGSVHNRYLELYNPGNTSVALQNYAISSAHGGSDERGLWEFWIDFPSDAVIEPAGVYVICDSKSHSTILEQCDFAYQDFAANQDVITLVKGSITAYIPLDRVGDGYASDVFTGWEVCGQANGLQNQRIIKKPLTNGSVEWAESAGTSVGDCDWIIGPGDDFSQLGNHDYAGEPENTTDFKLAGTRAVLRDYNPEPGAFEYDGFDVSRTGTAISVGLRSAPLNIENLQNGANGRDYREAVLRFPLESLPVGEGTATFDLEITSGIDNQFDSGESRLHCQIFVEWTSDGTIASIDEPTQSVDLTVWRSSLKLKVSIGAFDILAVSADAAHAGILEIKLMSALSEAVKLDAGLFSSLLTPRTLHLKMSTTLPIVDSTGETVNEVNTILRLLNG